MAQANSAAHVDLEHGSGPRRAPGKPAAPPVRLTDWLMLLLAVVSVGLLVWITFFDVSELWTRRVVLADYVVCGVFAVEFVVRWRRSGLGARFMRLYWYEILGMVPISHPAFRSFRLIRVVIILLRLGRAADRAFGDRVTGRLVDRFAETIVEVIRRPVTVAVMDEVAAVLQTGHYTRNIALALEENRGELDQMIVELVREDRQLGRLRFVPFHDDIIRLVSDTVFRLVNQVLADPRTDELIADALRENIQQMRQTVRGKYEAERVGR